MEQGKDECPRLTLLRETWPLFLSSSSLAAVSLQLILNSENFDSDHFCWFLGCCYGGEDLCRPLL